MEKQVNVISHPGRKLLSHNSGNKARDSGITQSLHPGCFFLEPNIHVTELYFHHQYLVNHNCEWNSSAVEHYVIVG